MILEEYDATNVNRGLIFNCVVKGLARKHSRLRQRLIVPCALSVELTNLSHRILQIIYCSSLTNRNVYVNKVIE